MNFYCKNKINLIDIMLGILTIALTFVGLKYYYSKDLGLLDFGINRTVCGYVLYGYNPIQLIGKDAIIESLGAINMRFGNMPFGLLLGNLFYFGFLPFDIALKCFRMESFILLLITIILSCRYIYKHYKTTCSNKLIYYFILFSIASANIIGPVRIGNAGHMLCMCIVLAILYIDENKILSGICLAFAMTKPQLALPLCISLLLYKKWIPLFIAASIDIVASLVCALLINENVFTFFIESYGLNMNLNATPYFGFLSIFNLSNPSSTTIYSMILGVILVVVCYVLLDKRADNLIKFSFPIMISCFWSYGWSSEHYVIIIPTLLMLICCYTTKKIYLKIYFILIALFLHFHWYFKSGIRDIIIKYNTFGFGYDFFINKTIANTFVYSVFIIIIFTTIWYINGKFIRLDNRTK